VIDAPIGFQKNGTMKRTTRAPKDAKEAMTEYVVRERFSGATFLELRPKTGRTHQIRVHLASIGHPILGDVLYGGAREKDRAPRVMLHASAIEFVGRDGKRLKIEAGLPEDFSRIIHTFQNKDAGDMV
jgi:23S rRNA pseudouridine1911/1915/1917 synthase